MRYGMDRILNEYELKWTEFLVNAYTFILYICLDVVFVLLHKNFYTKMILNRKINYLLKNVADFEDQVF